MAGAMLLSDSLSVEKQSTTSFFAMEGDDIMYHEIYIHTYTHTYMIHTYIHKHTYIHV